MRARFDAYADGPHDTLTINKLIVRKTAKSLSHGTIKDRIVAKRGWGVARRATFNGRIVCIQAISACHVGAHDTARAWRALTREHGAR